MAQDHAVLVIECGNRHERFRGRARAATSLRRRVTDQPIHEPVGPLPAPCEGGRGLRKASAGRGLGAQ
jgi:hypothetical protein